MSTNSQLTIMLNRTGGQGSVKIPTNKTGLGELQLGQSITFEVKDGVDGKGTDFSASRYEGDRLLKSTSGPIGSGSWVNAYLDEGHPHHIRPDGHATFEMTADGLEYVNGATGYPLGDDSYYAARKQMEADTEEEDLRLAVMKVNDSIASQVPRREDGGDNKTIIRTYFVRATIGHGHIAVDVDNDGTLVPRLASVGDPLSGEGIQLLDD
jgi:hypothetical protein